MAFVRLTEDHLELKLATISFCVIRLLQFFPRPNSELEANKSFSEITGVPSDANCAPL